MREIYVQGNKLSERHGRRTPWTQLLVLDFSVSRKSGLVSDMLTPTTGISDPEDWPLMLFFAGGRKGTCNHSKFICWVLPRPKGPLCADCLLFHEVHTLDPDHNIGSDIGPDL